MTPSIPPKTALLTLALVLTAVVGWELFCRSLPLPLSYNDDESLWASKRREVYQSSPAGPVLIGSSRMNFDLDQPTWTAMTGHKPVQLSVVGTSPRPLLTDLGNDSDFRGTVLIDVTEALFFAPSGGPPDIEVNKRLKHYPTWSLAQQGSFRLNRVLEDHLYFLDESRFSLHALLRWLPIPSRPGVFVFPNFPLNFNVNDPDRQVRFAPSFLTDTASQRRVREIWVQLGGTNPKRGVGGDTLTAMLDAVKTSVDAIRARGGRVLFLRTPSDGACFNAEKQSHPRDLYWDRLLAHTQTPGIYSADYPALSGFRCPEWSHLTPADAATFTKALIPIIQEKTGWKLMVRP